ncbi:unnamed protein product [Arabis nemorensis]|uniref:SWIM-type domain-containing protein n=1 Tax=Arabis nemorensis TaxID=586526 RepID=A0A565CR83_9BRAS|nr:unnamed protein product [Arabis nemorensis]
MTVGHKKCSCGVFYIEKIPCSHAIAALISAGQQVSTAVCPSFAKDYLYPAYSQNIYPLNDALKGREAVPCLPPYIKPRPGRKKKSRWQIWLEIVRMKGTKQGRFTINTTVQNASKEDIQCRIVLLNTIYSLPICRRSLHVKSV